MQGLKAISEAAAMIAVIEGAALRPRGWRKIQRAAL